jgi:putative redox protein
MEMIIDFPGGARVDAHFGPYTVQTDQSAHGAGGAASAPTPFATFLAALYQSAFKRITNREAREAREARKAGNATFARFARFAVNYATYERGLVLGACAGFYVLSFCQRRGIATDGLRLVQQTETDSDSGMVRTVRLEIELPPAFPEQYRAAVIRAAEQCAVKKLLEHPPAFEIRTVASEAVHPPTSV